MLNKNVANFYDSFGLIFQGSEDKATDDIENWSLFTATCFSNVAVMGSLDVRPSVCPSVRDVGEQ